MRGRVTVWSVLFAGLVLVASACAAPVGPPGPSPRPTDRLASSAQQICAVTPSGTVECWGSGYLGVAGSSGPVQRLESTTVAGLADATAIAMAGGAACVLEAGGTVSCWGRNDSGQLGNGTTTPSPTPVSVPGVADVVSLAMGGQGDQAQTCAVLADGGVRCWGANNYGQLGDGTTSTRSTPAPVVGLEPATQIAVGATHACAVVSGGAVRCWGSGRGYELGTFLPFDSLTPVVVLGAPPATLITAGGELDFGGEPEGFTCVLSTDGTEWCWGEGRQKPPTSDSRVPQPTGPDEIVDLTGACAIRADGSVQCSSDGGAWSQVDGPGDNIDVIDQNGLSCVLRSDGTAECRGANTGGQLGNGFGSFVATPRSPVGLDSVAEEIAPGDFHTCARLDSGEVSCWGNGALGQRGDGSYSYSATPTTVDGIADAIAVGSGEFLSCAVHDSGTVSCWGRGLESGQTNVPVPVAGISDAVDLDGGQGHVCALRSGGEVACWGNNSFGQLGDSTNTNSTDAVDVAGLTDAVAVVAGYNHSCAIRATGAVRCWGRNDSGDLGDGTTQSSSSPVDVVGLSDVVSMSAGFGSTCAVRTDQTVWCWGSNAGGIASGWSGDLAVPAPVTALSGVVQATAPANGVAPLCVTLVDGSVRCLGSNGLSGMLGNGTVGVSGGPVEPSGLAVTDVVESGASHVCALAVAGTVQCWGYDLDNQLGDGGPTDQPSFGPVLGLP